MDRFLHGKSVLRQPPDPNTILLSFRRDENRTQRRTDGTISILGKRFELPNAYRSLKRVTVRFAEWDLRNVHLVDPRTQACLAPIYPLDRRRNAEGLRRRIGSHDQTGHEPVAQADPPVEWPPLLQKLLAEHAASGLPPAYLSSPAHPKEAVSETENDHEKGSSQ